MYKPFYLLPIIDVKFYKLLFYIILFSGIYFAQTKKVVAIRTDTPPEIDGYLYDDCWKNAITISDFLQQEPISGNLPTYKTEVKILYDNENLYIGVMCYDDEPEKIIARELKWDGRMSGDDNFTLIFDTFNDKNNSYWFGTNPLGMHDDALLTGFDMSGFNESWNGVWDVRSQITSEGWSIEWIFPFSTFKFYEKEEQIWGINFSREIKRTGEVVQWTAIGRDKGMFKLSHAGELVGIKNINRGNPIYLKPFFSIGKEKRNEYEKNIYKPGLDIKYGISDQLSLDLTINTDFAQVESDKAVINLTRFPLFFPEKRDFFLEGANIFDFSLGESNRIFYSRRIGIFNGDEIPVIGGVKVVGKIANTEIGFITTQTARKNNQPSTNYSVARVKLEILKQSYTGFLITNKYSNGHFNRVYAADLNLSFDNFLGDKNIIIYSGFAKSDEQNNRKDSWAGNIYVYYPNDLINQNLAYRFIQKNFNPEMGFIRRGGVQLVSYDFGLSPRINYGIIKKLRFEPLVTELTLDDKSKMITGEFQIQPFGIQTFEGDVITFGLKRNYDRVENDFSIFGDKVIKKGEYWFNEWGIDGQLSRGRIIYGEFFIGGGNYFNGKKDNYYSSIVFSPNSKITLLIDYNYNFIDLENSHFSTSEIGTTFRYDFSTRVFSSVFAQWNNEIHELSLNYRFNWQPKIGSNFYFVVNQLFSTIGKLRSTSFTVLTKFVWMITM